MNIENIVKNILVTVYDEYWRRSPHKLCKCLTLCFTPEINIKIILNVNCDEEIKENLYL